MPAIKVENPSKLPRITVNDANVRRDRKVVQISTAFKMLEGAGFEVRRAFVSVDLRRTDPFLMLDQIGAVEYAPGEAKGAPDHPHRGFETVTYMMDGKLEHRDSNGGGGLITDGDTQWMTAGAGIVHSELPTADIVAEGGLFHGTQLWVNLPRNLKWSPPQYQDIRGNRVGLVASDDAGAVVRLIAGDLGDVQGPGVTQTPITYAHASISPGARLQIPSRPDFNAIVYVLSGSGAISEERRPIREGQMAVLGEGNMLTLYGGVQQNSRTPMLEVLLMGGQPIRQPIAWHGPFVMNTRAEIIQAFEDYHAGRMGSIPAKQRDGEG